MCPLTKYLGFIHDRLKRVFATLVVFRAALGTVSQDLHDRYGYVRIPTNASWLGGEDVDNHDQGKLEAPLRTVSLRPRTVEK